VSVVTNLVLEATTTLFDALGASAVKGGHGLDRHWRNARTHTLHDPVRWKLQHLGRHALTGQAPPRHGAI
jgi:alkylation response protein AidB-like acyl-CoA dehydrogenase